MALSVLQILAGHLQQLLLEVQGLCTSIHVTEVGDNLWVLHSTLDEYQGDGSIVQRAIFALVCVSITLLLIIICLSIWHGIPLLLTNP